MPITLDATAKGASANTYITLADAETYFLGRLNITLWTGASDADKNIALAMGTSRIDQEKFFGTATSLTQRLKWPRTLVEDDDQNYWDEDVVPRPVEEATCELALALLNEGTNDLLKDSGLEGFEEVGVGSLKVRPRVARKAGALPQQVIRLLRGLRSSGSGIVRLQRS